MENQFSHKIRMSEILSYMKSTAVAYNEAFFSSRIFLKFDIVTLSLLFDN